MTPPDSLPDVYVLSVDYRDGSTTIVRVSTDLDDLINHYGPDSLSPVLPWEPVATPFVEASDTSLWSTRFASGNDGAHLWIRRMPLHGRRSSTDAAGLLDNYDPTPGLVARGVMADPTEPTDDAADAQPGCPQCQGVNADQCPRCEFEAEYDADVTALSTLIADGLAAKQAPEQIARTILTSEWLDEANDRLVTPMIEGATQRLRQQVLALIPTDNPELIDAGYTILASDVLDRLNGHAHGQEQGQGRLTGRLDRSLATMSDAEAFRDGFYIDVPTISDGALIALMNDHSHLLAIAREYGWNETQVRDDFAAVLEARGHTLDGQSTGAAPSDGDAQENPADATVFDAKAFREAIDPDGEWRDLPDADLITLLNQYDDILDIAREVGWANTSVRELVTAILDKVSTRPPPTEPQPTAPA